SSRSADGCRPENAGRSATRSRRWPATGAACSGLAGEHRLDAHPYALAFGKVVGDDHIPLAQAFDDFGQTGAPQTQADRHPLYLIITAPAQHLGLFATAVVQRVIGQHQRLFAMAGTDIRRDRHALAEEIRRFEQLEMDVDGPATAVDDRRDETHPGLQHLLRVGVGNHQCRLSQSDRPHVLFIQRHDDFPTVGTGNLQQRLARLYQITGLDITRLYHTIYLGADPG